MSWKSSPPSVSRRICAVRPAATYSLRFPEWALRLPGSVSREEVSATGTSWDKGDFDYNSAVNFDDLLALAQAYGPSMLVDGTIVHSDVDFAADWALAQSMVPEPTTLLATALPLALARRRRV